MYLHSDFSHRRRVHWPDKATAFSLSFLHTKLLVGGCTDRQTDRAKSKEKSTKSITTKEKGNKGESQEDGKTEKKTCLARKEKTVLKDRTN